MAAPSPRTALITGGASGIGLGLTRSLLSQSYSVLIADRNAPTGLQVLADLQREFPSGCISFEPTDVTDFASLSKAFGRVVREWGRVDVVCAIAGISQVFTSPDGKDPFWGSARLDKETGESKAPNLAVINVNLIGVLNTVHLAIAHFRNQERDSDGFRGRLVAAGSTASLYPFPNESLYGAAKQGVLGTVRALAPTLKPEGISINAIAPSLVETGIGNPAAFVALREANALTPMSTITKAVNLLLSPQYILTGQILECCLDKLAFRTPPRMMDNGEARCMEFIWPCGEIEDALRIPREVLKVEGVSVVVG